ncbi:MAG: hypothetical protein JKY95_17660 [Planctomycetaceae bacterium]|nr:hypothetical protein [Planctomycetaceae bacterium]
MAFGDSTTASRGQLRVYSDLLQGEFRSRKIDAKVFNAGVGGNTTQRAGVRFEADVLSRKPDVTIIQFGINDSAVDVWRSPPSVKPRIGVDQYERNLRLFIQKLESQGSEIILMTPNSLRWTPKLKQLYGKSPYLPDEPGGFNVLLKKYAEVVRQVGKEQSVPVVDVFAAFEKYGKVAGQNVDDLLLDGMHPNEKGQQLVFDLLKKSQSLKSLLLSPSVR